MIRTIPLPAVGYRPPVVKRTRRFFQHRVAWLAMMTVWGTAASALAAITVTGDYSGDEARWTNGGEGKNGTIGGNADGSLTINGGSDVSLRNAFFGSGSSGGMGTITLTGTGSTLATSQAMFLGNDTGIGVLTISDGGTLSTTYTSALGSNGVTASGTMTIDGPGSIWEANDGVEVGREGQGTLTIQNQGALSTVDLILGVNPGSMGTLNLMGNGPTEHSIVTVSGGIGFRIGTDSEAFISNGGQLHSVNNVSVSGSLVLEGIGSEITSNNTFVVSGPVGAANAIVRNGATLSVSGLLAGTNGAGTLEVLGGGTVSVSGTVFEVGKNAGSDGTMTISGVGTTGTATSISVVGGSGTGTLRVLDGATLSVSGFQIGRDEGSNGAVTISGVGTTVTAAGGITIGVNGTGIMEVLDGSRLENSVSSISIGSGATGDGTLRLSGTGTVFQGSGTTASVATNGTGRLIIEEGARFNAFDRTASNIILNVGQTASSAEGFITVRTGGVLDLTFDNPDFNNDQIVFGNSLATGHLTVEDGGIVHSESTFFGTDAGTEGYFTITGSTSTANMRNLYAAQAEGSYGEMTISDGATVHVESDFSLLRGVSNATIRGGATVDAGDDVTLGRDFGTATLTLTGNGSRLSGADQFLVGFSSSDPGNPSMATMDVGRGATIVLSGNEIANQIGLGFAIGAGSTAVLRMTIGDDGTGNISSGFIDAGGLFFGDGSSTLEIDVDAGVFLLEDDSFELVGYDTWDGNFFDNVGDGGIIFGGGYHWLIDYDADLGDRFGIVATVVPEPGTAGLILMALAVMLLWKRRNCQRRHAAPALES